MPRIIKSEHTRWVDGNWVVQAPPLEGAEEPKIDYEAMVAEAQEKARQLIEGAQAEAEAMMAQAEAKCQQLIEEVTRAAYDDGLSQGREEAFQQGLAEWSSRLEAATAAGQATLAERAELLAQAEPDLVRLALLIASKLLQREPKDANLVKNLVASAIAKLTGQDLMRVRLNPQDVSKLVNPLQPPPKYEVVADAAVGLGGCILETQTGRVDASFATQFEELVRTALEVEVERDEPLKGSFGELRKPPAAGPKGGGARGGGGFGGGFGR